MILLRGNGYKALAATQGDDDLRLVIAELMGKMVCVAEGNLDVAVGFADRSDEIGVLGTIFNRMVHQLNERREEQNRCSGRRYRVQNDWPHPENSLLGWLTKCATCSPALPESSTLLSATCL